MPLFPKGTHIGVTTHERTFDILLLIADALARKGDKDVMLFTSKTGFAIGQMSSSWTVKAPNTEDVEYAPVIFWSLKESRTPIGCRETTDRG